MQKKAGVALTQNPSVDTFKTPKKPRTKRASPQPMTQDQFLSKMEEHTKTYEKTQEKYDVLLRKNMDPAVYERFQTVTNQLSKEAVQIVSDMPKMSELFMEYVLCTLHYDYNKYGEKTFQMMLDSAPKFGFAEDGKAIYRHCKTKEESQPKKSGGPNPFANRPAPKQTVRMNTNPGMDGIVRDSDKPDYLHRIITNPCFITFFQPMEFFKATDNFAEIFWGGGDPLVNSRSIPLPQFSSPADVMRLPQTNELNTAPRWVQNLRSRRRAYEETLKEVRRKEGTAHGIVYPALGFVAGVCLGVMEYVKKIDSYQKIMDEASSREIFNGLGKEAESAKEMAEGIFHHKYAETALKTKNDPLVEKFAMTSIDRFSMACGSSEVTGHKLLEIFKQSTQATNYRTGETKTDARLISLFNDQIDFRLERRQQNTELDIHGRYENGEASLVFLENGQEMKFSQLSDKNQKDAALSLVMQAQYESLQGNEYFTGARSLSRKIMETSREEALLYQANKVVEVARNSEGKLNILFAKYVSFQAHAIYATHNVLVFIMENVSVLSKINYFILPLRFIADVAGGMFNIFGFEACESYLTEFLSYFPSTSITQFTVQAATQIIHDYMERVTNNTEEDARSSFADILHIMDFDAAFVDIHKGVYLLCGLSFLYVTGKITVSYIRANRTWSSKFDVERWMDETTVYVRSALATIAQWFEIPNSHTESIFLNKWGFASLKYRIFGILECFRVAAYAGLYTVNAVRSLKYGCELIQAIGELTKWFVCCSWGIVYDSYHSLPSFNMEDQSDASLYDKAMRIGVGYGTKALLATGVGLMGYIIYQKPLSVQSTLQLGETLCRYPMVPILLRRYLIWNRNDVIQIKKYKSMVKKPGQTNEQILEVETKRGIFYLEGYIRDDLSYLYPCSISGQPTQTAINLMNTLPKQKKTMEGWDWARDRMWAAIYKFNDYSSTGWEVGDYKL
jgi:hypothetical protein